MVVTIVPSSEVENVYLMSGEGSTFYSFTRWIHKHNELYTTE